MRIVYLILAVCLMTSCAKTEEKKLTLTTDGTSDYEIVYMGGANEIEYKAALELAKYIALLSGAELALVDESSQSDNKKKIYVGSFRAEQLKKDEVSIQTDGETIFLAGGSDTALQNTIYVFLEEFMGCKWYAPDAEVVPKSTTIIMDSIHYSYTPEITTRTVHSKLFYDNQEFAKKHKVTLESFPKYVPAARVHTFHRFLPEEKFYKAHPEYFALRGKQRLPTQLCLTNEKVLEIIKDSVAALFKRNPESLVVSVSQDDNQQHCQCDNCSTIDKEEGSPSGTMIRFVNKVAKAFPDKMISTLAYQHTRKPPKTRPAENVLITLCSIECDRSAPIAENCMDFAEDLIGWGKQTNNIRVWDYTTQFTNFLAPFPNMLTLKPNIELFANNNAKWIFEQHSNNPSELFELRSYVTAKLLWNPDAEFDELVTDFTNGYYEEAGPFVKVYVDLIHQKIQEDEDFFLFLYGDPSEAFDSYLSPEMLATYTGIFNQAEVAIASKPTIAARVKKARLGVDYAVLEASRKNLTDHYSLMSKNDQGDLIENPIVTKLLADFKNTCDTNEISLMNEMGFTVAEYHANYVSALAVAKKPNKALGKKVVSLTKPKKYADENPMVLTDGALGGSSFYANWLGYEGNDLEVVLDLEEPQEITTISMAFLQVTNHIVFLPESVTYLGSIDGKTYFELGRVANENPLNKKSKVNDIQYFDLKIIPRRLRFLKVKANTTETPYWHHAAGLPSWLFADEILVD